MKAGWTISAVLHGAVLAWGLVTFATKPLNATPPEFITTDIISDADFSQITQGIRTAPKAEAPKPLVEKVAEAKPVEEQTAKVVENKPEIVATADQVQPPKPPEPKKAEPKPQTPQPQAKPEPKQAFAKEPEPKVDPIAEAIKKEEKKPPPKPVQAAKPPEPQKPRIVERHFDQSQIAALLDKRDPTRQAVANDTLNSNAALGLSKGTAADNSATWGSMFQRQVERCWKKPYGGIESQKPEVAFAIRLKRDGTLEGSPVPEGTPATPYLRVYQESALRAIIECQPYNLPAAYFDEWKYFTPVFTERKI